MKSPHLYTFTPQSPKYEKALRITYLNVPCFIYPQVSIIAVFLYFIASFPLFHCIKIYLELIAFFSNIVMDTKIRAAFSELHFCQEALFFQHVFQQLVFSFFPQRYFLSQKNKKKKKAQQTQPHPHPTTMRRTVELGAQMKACGTMRAQSRRMQQRIPTAHL